MVGEILIRWTARAAVACYAVRLWRDAGGVGTDSYSRRTRWWWTMGCGWFAVHVATAFHFEHGWNHSAAFEYTAKRTAEMTGWNSGAGLYLNEAFLCLWCVDTILWWSNLAWPRNRRAYWAIQGVFAFMMIQATAVFGPPLWKPLVLLLTGLVMWQIVRSRRGRRHAKLLDPTESLHSGNQSSAD